MGKLDQFIIAVVVCYHNINCDPIDDAKNVRRPAMGQAYQRLVPAKVASALENTTGAIHNLLGMDFLHRSYHGCLGYCVHRNRARGVQYGRIMVLGWNNGCPGVFTGRPKSCTTGSELDRRNQAGTPPSAQIIL